MSQYRSVTAFAPASVGNAGVGFDIMGFAIEGVGDKVTITIADENFQKIKLRGKYGNLIPAERNKNTAGVAIDAYLKATGNSKLNLQIELEKNLPLGSGLGSSASSSVAAVLAINELTGNLLDKNDLIPFAMEGERVACGSAHADNVAPSLLGGLILIRDYDPLDIISIPLPDDLYCTVVHPHYKLLTSLSRSVLKKEISLQLAIKQNANTAAFITGLLTNDVNLMNCSFNDYLAEPFRAELIPGFLKVKEAALITGAIGCSISGSGPSVFALSRNEIDAMNISEAMAKEFKKVNLDSDIFISPLNAPGAKIINKN